MATTLQGNVSDANYLQVYWEVKNYIKKTWNIRLKHFKHPKIVTELIYSANLHSMCTIKGNGNIIRIDLNIAIQNTQEQM